MRYRVARPFKHPKSSRHWFRLSVPKDLRQKIGKSEIKQSLGTSDPEEAQILEAQLTAQWKAKFRALREAAVADHLATAPAIVEQFLQILSNQRYGDEDGVIHALQKLITFQLLTAWGPDEFRARQADLVMGNIPDEMWGELESDPDPSQDIIPERERDALVARMRLLQRRDTFGAGFQDAIQYIMTTRRWDVLTAHIMIIEDFTGTSIPVGSPLFDAVAEYFVKRLLDYRSYRWDMNLIENQRPAQLSIETTPPAVHPGINETSPPSNLWKEVGMQPLSEGLKRWKDIRKPGASAAVEAERAVERFIELYGDKPVANITADEMHDYKDFIENMPANLSLPKIKKSGRSLRRAVTQAWIDKPEAGKLSPASVKKDVGALAAIFSALHEDRWIRTNPATGITVSGYSKKRKGQKNPRLPLRPSMMKDLFASPLFTGCAGKADIKRTQPGTHLFQDEMYWTFLFGATAGPRLEEVGQILIDDIEVLEQEGQPPIAGIYITGTAAGQSVKTDESMRVLVVHPKLMELGFLAFVEQRRQAKAKRLFDLKQSANGTWTKELSRRMNRYIDRTITKDPRYVWYSMRHEFADRSEINISTDVSKKIMGHARGRLYGLGAPLHHAAKELEKLDLSFVDWDRLKAAAGR